MMENYASFKDIDGRELQLAQPRVIDITLEFPS